MKYFILFNLRSGSYAFSTDSGKTWENRVIYNNKFGCFDERVIIKTDGEMTVGFSKGSNCKNRIMMHSLDDGKTWSREKSAD